MLKTANSKVISNYLPKNAPSASGVKTRERSGVTPPHRLIFLSYFSKYVFHFKKWEYLKNVFVYSRAYKILDCSLLNCTLYSAGLQPAVRWTGISWRKLCSLLDWHCCWNFIIILKFSNLEVLFLLPSYCNWIYTLTIE